MAVAQRPMQIGDRVRVIEHRGYSPPGTLLYVERVNDDCFTGNYNTQLTFGVGYRNNHPDLGSVRQVTYYMRRVRVEPRDPTWQR